MAGDVERLRTPDLSTAFADLKRRSTLPPTPGGDPGPKTVVCGFGADGKHSSLTNKESGGVIDHANGSVTTIKIASLAVTTAELGNLAVTTAKVNDLAITDGKLAGSITDGKLASGVGTANGQIAKNPSAADGTFYGRAGGAWGAQANPAAGKITAPSGPSAGDLLRWNGSAWVASTVSQSAPTRALNTVYGNGNGRTMLVTVTVSLQVYKAASATISGISYAEAHVDTDSPPTSIVAKVLKSLSLYDVDVGDRNSFDEACMTFLVPPGYNYQIATGQSGDGVAPILYYWTEWLL